MRRPYIVALACAQVACAASPGPRNGVVPATPVASATSLATRSLRSGPSPRWYRATPLAQRSPDTAEWSVADVVLRGICVPHPWRVDACFSDFPHAQGEVRAITWNQPREFRVDSPMLKPSPTSVVTPTPSPTSVVTPTPEPEPVRYPDQICRMVENGADVLRFCDHYLGRSTSTGWHIERIDEAGVARLEKSFTLDTDAWPAPARIPPFAQYDGVVAFHGTCSGQHDRTRLCLRRSGGTFEELATPMPIPSNASVHGLDGEAGPELVAWIPGVDAWTFVLPRQGRVVHFNDEEAQRIDEQVRTATGETLTGRYRTCVLVARAGDVLRYACASQSSASAIELDLGTKSVRAEPYPDADGHGSFGLRFEGGHLLESVDGWRTWHRVAAPEPNLHGPIRCHRMGCEVGDWIRLGWGSAKR